MEHRNFKGSKSTNLIFTFRKKGGNHPKKKKILRKMSYFNLYGNN